MIRKINPELLIENPNNPRIIEPDKYKKLVQSIKDFPQMLDLRPIVVDENLVVLGGNMRLKAIKEVGLTEVPFIKVEDLTEEQKKEFIIKDNVGYGIWDWEVLDLEWDTIQLQEWGIDFDINEETEEEKYSNKIKAPTYEPSDTKPDLKTLVDLNKMYDLLNEIESAPIEDNDKEFLRLASYRHIVFDYSKIADYYAHADSNLQELMEKSGLVIIDYNKAISEGYVKLSNTLTQLYLEDHSNDE